MAAAVVQVRVTSGDVGEIRRAVRVVVASDTLGGWSSAEAGRALAGGWESAAVRVLPVGEAGGGFIQALADQLGTTVATSAIAEVLVSTARTADVAVVGAEGPAGGSDIPYDATSRPLGEAMAEVLAGGPAGLPAGGPTGVPAGGSAEGPAGVPAGVGPRQLFVDLAGLSVHDGGAGLLSALGATADRPLDAGVAGLAGLSRLELGPARDRLAGVELVGVVPGDQLKQPLLGLRGITSLAGRGAGTPAELMLSTDATLERLAELLDVSPVPPGSGACGGLGLAVLALGGRLTTGPALTLGALGSSPVDLVVTGCSVFDFATRGGGVVAAVAEAAVTLLSPCIVVAGEVLIGSREMRTMGIEAAYAVRESVAAAPVAAAVTQEELRDTGRRVARSWSW
jgi:glycerate kinase